MFWASELSQPAIQQKGMLPTQSHLQTTLAQPAQTCQPNQPSQAQISLEVSIQEYLGNIDSTRLFVENRKHSGGVTIQEHPRTERAGWTQSRTPTPQAPLEPT